MYEEKAQKITKQYLENLGYDVEEFPHGKLGVDILAKDKEGKNTYVEVKGTKTKNPKKKDKNGNLIEEFDQNQNKHHYSYGLFQLMTRLKSDNDIGLLFLPHHTDFEKLLKNTEYLVKKLGIGIYLIYSENNIKRVT
jgi:RecB family endonuclease NucS|tara:strand:- start:126 stop:536 length:411 start_codon:yes stop_codon:yes gene_type:complete